MKADWICLEGELEYFESHIDAKWRLGKCLCLRRSGDYLLLPKGKEPDEPAIKVASFKGFLTVEFITFEIGYVRFIVPATGEHVLWELTGTGNKTEAETYQLSTGHEVKVDPQQTSPFMPVVIKRREESKAPVYPTVA